MVIHWLRNLFQNPVSRSRQQPRIKRRVRSTTPACLEMLELRRMLTMSVPTVIEAGANLNDVQTADFNNDGKQDVVGLNSATGMVSVMLGTGDGSFQAAINSAAGGTGVKMSIADFNHDGNLDIVTVQGSQIDVLKGHGDGSFQAPVAYYASALPNDVDVGDINNDGSVDIFTCSFSYGGTTQLFMNDGAGNFLPSRNLAIGPTGLQVEGADVNNDGNLDLVQSSGTGYVAVLMGHGDGTFVSAGAQNLGMSTTDIKVDDFNGDGKADLAVTSGSQISVFSGNGTTTFQPATSYSLANATRIQTGDVNGDARDDIVANNGSVLLGRGDGSFYAPTQYGTSVGSSIALGDLNGDGALDAVAGTATGSTGATVSLNARNDVQLLAGATRISITTTGSAIAGTPFAVTATALDSNGNVVTDFQGTVGILGAPGTTPVSYTFTAADAGSHTIDNAATLFAAGQGTYTVTSPFLPDATGSVTVQAAAAGKFTVTAQTSSVAGEPTSVTVSAQDIYGNFVNNFAGTIHFSSSDSQAELPADYTFSADDAGAHTFAVTLKTAGSQAISVGDSSNAAAHGTSNAIGVSGGAAVSLTGGSGYVGSVNAVTITARDAYGNVATGYHGIVHLASSDPSAAVSADAALVNGVGVFTVTSTTLGVATLTASDVGTGIIIGSENINLTPGWGVQFVVDALPSSMAAGQTQTTTMTVYDAYGNVSTVYTGFVAVAASDGRTSYVYFTPADHGVLTVPVTLYTAGAQAVTYYDLANPGVTFTQTGITVTPGAVSSISVTPLQGVTAGSTQGFSVNARDVYGNIATGYRGTVNFASSDSQASLPAAYTFTEADGGSHTFQVTYRSAGGQDITVADTTTPVTAQYYQVATMSYYQRDIMITPAAFSSFAFKGNSISNSTAGSSINVTMTAADAYGNAITGYTGTVQITSSDSQASFPSSYTFTPADSGSHMISVVLKTAGSQSLSVTDGTVSGSLTGLNIKAGAASTFSINCSRSVTAGTAQAVTLTVTDAYGNAVTNYTGTVKFSSSDVQAGLPASYTFSNKDSGTHTFSVTFLTAGTQSLTAVDAVNRGMTATQSGIVVNPSAAQATSFTVTGFPSTTAGAAKTFTVTARDAQGNVVTGYRGTVVFSSSDLKAGLPASYTFTSADAGSHQFTGVLITSGTQSITVTDNTSSKTLGSQTGIIVGAGAASQFVISAPASVTQGVGFKFTMTVYDSYGNIATGYRGKVHLSSTDAKGGASDYTFSNSDNGVHTFSYTFNTLGSQSLFVTDTANSLFTTKFSLNVVSK